MRKSLLVALVVLAGCGSSDKVSTDQTSAEFGLNRGPQDWTGQASTPEQAARALADDDVQKAGGAWKITIAHCKESGPIISCDMAAKGGKGDVTCSAQAAVRVTTAKSTARRTPWACGGGI